MNPEPINEFQIGDRVDKREGYTFPGTVRCVYLTEAGQPRVVVELTGFGLQHIFRPDQLRHRQ